jgi:hypothetical protein
VALFNREVCANLLEVWRRFGRLVRDGASREQVAGFLEVETYQLDNAGVHFGYRYSGSPVVSHEPGPPPPWRWASIVPTTWPGGRAPAVRLAGGGRLYDRLGTGFTLVDTSGELLGEPLVKEADRRNIPIHHLVLDDEMVRRVWGRRLVLVRPDQHIVWRGDQPPTDPAALLDLVCGLA